MLLRRLPALALTLCSIHTAAQAAPLFDELRFGAAASIESNDNREQGGFVSGIALFDAFGRGGTSGWRQVAIPRLHVGADVSTAGEANQAYAGFSWTVDLGSWVFLEGGLGGTIHDGQLSDDGTPGPKLGSAVLFHEYAAIGLNLDPHWRLLATVQHSSHAELADGPNSGLSRAGVQMGYKF